MYPEFTGLVTAGGHHAPLPPAYDHGLSFQRGIVEYLYRNKKRVEIKMGYDALLFQGVKLRITNDELRMPLPGGGNSKIKINPAISGTKSLNSLLFPILQSV